MKLSKGLKKLKRGWTSSPRKFEITEKLKKVPPHAKVQIATLKRLVQDAINIRYFGLCETLNTEIENVQTLSKEKERLEVELDKKIAERNFRLCKYM